MVVGRDDRLRLNQGAGRGGGGWKIVTDPDPVPVPVRQGGARGASTPTRIARVTRPTIAEPNRGGGGGRGHIRNRIRIPSRDRVPHRLAVLARQCVQDDAALTHTRLLDLGLDFAPGLGLGPGRVHPALTPLAVGHTLRARLLGLSRDPGRAHHAPLAQALGIGTHPHPPPRVRVPAPLHLPTSPHLLLLVLNLNQDDGPHHHPVHHLRVLLASEV